MTKILSVITLFSLISCGIEMENQGSNTRSYRLGAVTEYSDTQLTKSQVETLNVVCNALTSQANYISQYYSNLTHNLTTLTKGCSEDEFSTLTVVSNINENITYENTSAAFKDIVTTSNPKFSTVCRDTTNSDRKVSAMNKTDVTITKVDVFDSSSSNCSFNSNTQRCIVFEKSYYDTKVKQYILKEAEVFVVNINNDPLQYGTVSYREFTNSLLCASNQKSIKIQRLN